MRNKVRLRPALLCFDKHDALRNNVRVDLFTFGSGPTLAGNASDSVSVGRVLEHANEDDDGLSEEGGQPAEEGEPSGSAGMGGSWWLLLLLGALASHLGPRYKYLFN